MIFESLLCMRGCYWGFIDILCLEGSIREVDVKGISVVLMLINFCFVSLSLQVRTFSQFLG